MTAQPTARELEVLAAYCRHHSTKLAAHELGITDKSARKRLSHLYARLDVASAIEAAEMLGWLTVPDGATSVA